MKQEIIEHCLSKRHSYKDYPFDDVTLVIKVHKKIFAIFGENSISLKCDPNLAVNLRNQFEGVKPGWHLNKSHWNTVSFDSDVPIDEIKWQIDHSYELVFSSLPKKLQIL